MRDQETLLGPNYPLGHLQNKRHKFEISGGEKKRIEN